MEEAAKEQQSSVVHGSYGKSKLRYPLRSAMKLKEDKSSVTESSQNSDFKRGRATPSVSKSMGVLNISGNEKSAKPPRRLSVPNKSAVTPVSKSTIGNITPISETRSKRSVNVEGKCGTPLSEVSRTSNRKRFNTLASASYWLSQIRLSESAVKHSISLGFFKLALEAGCEPIQRIRDELKSYVKRNDLGEMEEAVKELLQSYGTTENQEQVQVSQTCSQVPEEGTWSSEEEVRSNTESVGNRKPHPRSINSDIKQDSSLTTAANPGKTQKDSAATKTRSSLSKRTANLRSVKESGSKSMKRTQKGSKQESIKEQDKIKRQGEKIASDEGPITPPGIINQPEENKENVDAPQMEETTLLDVI